MAKTPVAFTHNGTERAVFVDGGQNLLDVLRRALGDLTPKYGCGQGTCGACTVLVDGAPRLACLTLAETVADRHVETVAGLAAERPAPLQQAFMDHFAAQCGYCTCGMLMSATALLRHNPRPSREDVVEAISGNLCRCTGYEAIIEAVLTAAHGAPSRAGAR
ncbi:(2Fe-2S)-binding protein [Acuticoccus sp.]|uniref:(2Fe-2S)-binding protein n=1 Tax=Acuticoccus sp. TaxID=1904378 RepID=UPI003B518122